MNVDAPMKEVVSDHPFSGPAWVFERKLEGERCRAIRRRREVSS